MIPVPALALVNAVLKLRFHKSLRYLVNKGRHIILKKITNKQIDMFR